MLTTNASEVQPKALPHLFFTELWERFAYFAIQSILVLFMSKALGYSDHDSYMIYSAFTALLFITPLLGGYLADNFIGYVHAIILGIVFLAAGYFLLATTDPKLLLLSLAILIVGNGFFKPNISTILGFMYNPNAKNREAGFMIFYLGINIGATIGVIVCGFVAKSFGLSLAIAIAAVGLLIGGTVFLLSHQVIRKEAELAFAKIITNRVRKILISYVLVIVSVVVIWLLMKHATIANFAVIIAAILLLMYLAVSWFRTNKQERGKFLVCIILIIFSVAFWALYQQSFMSVVMYLSRLVNLRILNTEIPPSVISSLNGIFLIVFTPGVIKFWQKLRNKSIEPSVVTKFALGIVLMGFGYLILHIDATSVSTTDLASLGPIIFSYAIQTLGELFLSPVGLAMITILSPEKMRGMMMGVWFFALAAATAIGGQLARLTDGAASLGLLAAATIYGHAFLVYGCLAVTIALVLLLATKRLGRLLVQQKMDG